MLASVRRTQIKCGSSFRKAGKHRKRKQKHRIFGSSIFGSISLKVAAIQDEIDTQTMFRFTLCLSLFAGSAAFVVTPKWAFSSTVRAGTALSADDLDDVIMVNGMPGPMATAAAEACLRKGLKLAPVAMTGPDIEPTTITVVDKVTDSSSEVKLIPSTDVDEIKSSLAGMREASNILVIDYTHPSAVNSNAQFYVENGLPFVMGTTGGDRDQLMKDVENHFCVIAPNMGKQIVAMQAGLSDLAKKYPGAFAGYKLDVTESHQKTKADTSGTAKAVIESLKTLSADKKFTNDDINMIRDDKEAVAFGVPDTEDSLKGHAFHTYTFTSPDGSVQFQLKHNVAGRTIYAEGTADAVKFLAKKMKTEKDPHPFNMINVLEEGALE